LGEPVYPSGHTERQSEKGREKKKSVFFFLNGVCDIGIVRERVNRERKRERGFDLFIKYVRFLWLVYDAGLSCEESDKNKSKFVK